MSEMTKGKQAVALKEMVDLVDVALAQLATVMKSTVDSVWEAGELLVQLHDRGLSDQAITDYLKEAGVRVERTTINLYRLLYDYYVNRYGFDVEYLKRFTIYQLALIRRVLVDYPVERDMLAEILKRAEGQEARQSEEIAMRAIGHRREESNAFANIRVPYPLKEKVAEARERLQNISDSVGIEGKVSDVNVIEFIIAVFDAMSDDMLRQLWREAHGEAEE